MPVHIELHFEYSFEDYREAGAAHQARLVTRQLRTRRSGLLCWAVAILLLITLFLLHYGRTYSRQTFALAAHAMLTLLPWASLVIIMVLLNRAAAKSLSHAKTLLMVVTAGTTVAAAGLLWVRNLTPPPADSGALATLIAWTVLVVLTASTYWNLTGDRPYRRGWDGQQNLHPPKSMTIRDDRIVVQDALVRQEYHWAAFRRVEQTPNLYVLYVSDLAFHMLPKRAFAGVQQMQTFEALADQQVNGRTRAFPVLPVDPAPGLAQPPPLPPSSAPAKTGAVPGPPSPSC